MASLSYTIRNATDKSATIYLFFNYGTKKRFRYNTKLKVLNAKNWDNGKMRIKNVMAEINREIINEKLDEVQSQFNKKYTELTLSSELEVNDENLKSIAAILFNHKEETKEEERELLPFFIWYIEFYSKNPVPTNGKPIASSTLRTYKNAYNKLLKFQKENYKLSYNKITLDFYEDYIGWLYEEDYSTNYIGTLIKVLKTIMNSSYEKGLHSNLDFKKNGFRKPTEEVSNVYLSIEELKTLHKADFGSFKLKITDNGVRITRKKLELARDLFLISAFTGLRVGDFNRLTSEHIINRNGEDYIEILTQKTGKPVAIPIHPVVMEILQKRNGNPPQHLPEQHINYAIKIAAEKAELNDSVTKTITKAGKKISKPYFKYELISNHTGRRSFCTNAYLSGMATVDIMAISGHNSEKVFYTYIKADHLQKAAKIAQHPFFKG
jgi:integrase